LTGIVGEKRLPLYFAMPALTSNFCYGFSTSLNMFSPKIKSLCLR